MADRERARSAAGDEPALHAILPGCARTGPGARRRLGSDAGRRCGVRHRRLRRAVAAPRLVELHGRREGLSAAVVSAPGADRPAMRVARYRAGSA